MTSEPAGGPPVSPRDPFPTWLFVTLVVLVAVGIGYTVATWGGLGPGLDYAAPRVAAGVAPVWRTAPGALEWAALALFTAANLAALAHLVWLKARRRQRPSPPTPIGRPPAN